MLGFETDPMSTKGSRQSFGHLTDGTPVELVRLFGEQGFEARIITYGAALHELMVPDRHGAVADVVLGEDDIASYEANRRYFGATIGRYANRIAGGAFTLDGRDYRLAVNNGANALHGGVAGFDRHVWQVAALGAEPVPFVTLSRRSVDGEEGYPGNLDVEVTYAVTGATELSISFTATTDRPTIANLTNHGFFNLAGEGSGDILSHVLTIAADHYLPVDAGSIPLGAPVPVAGTPFDFREARRIGARIRENHEQLRLGRGYDHNYCLASERLSEPRLAARLEESGSGRVLELFTDQPGLQFYSGNFLDGTVTGKRGRLYRQSDALCLEPQAWPDTPNRPDFPSARLDIGETYRHTSIYRFSVA
ncbi:MAG: Aldose 1-epimerase [Xanthobacteraceae bacterium]|jgi:aldose 1-epimerase|nr:Aldose 1-epimerase [Xanthobacteraceae bacterium]